jgi:hypothetical protein
MMLVVSTTFAGFALSKVINVRKMAHAATLFRADSLANAPRREPRRNVRNVSPTRTNVRRTATAAAESAREKNANLKTKPGNDLLERESVPDKPIIRVAIDPYSDC